MTFVALLEVLMSASGNQRGFFEDRDPGGGGKAAGCPATGSCDFLSGNFQNDVCVAEGQDYVSNQSTSSTDKDPGEALTTSQGGQVTHKMAASQKNVSDDRSVYVIHHSLFPHPEPGEALTTF